jgi:flagellar biogenesis protein FliO
MIATPERPESPTAQTASVQAESQHVAEMKIRIEFGAASMAGQDVEGLELGSVIELESKVSDDVEVFVDGVLFARGEAVLVKAQACPPGTQPGDDKIGVAVREIIHDLDRRTLGRYQGDAGKVAQPPSAVSSWVSEKAKTQPRAAVPHVKKLAMIALVAALTLWPSISTAQTTSGPGDDQSNQLVKSSTDSRPLNGGDTRESSWMPTLQTLLALAVVIALIYACRYVLRRLGKGTSLGVADSGVIEVLSRTGIGARQQLLLVRLGRRLVLVGCWPSGMAGLSEITDLAEINALTSSVEAGGAGGSARAVADKIRNRLDAKESK